MLFHANTLSFTRNDISVFSNISFYLKAGDLLQISGANGSGKTTLLKILCGLLIPSAGEIFWQGISIKNCRQDYLVNLEFVGHLAGIKNNLTVKENLQIAKVLSRTALHSMANALEQVGLNAYPDQLVQHLSAGQKRRLLVAKLLLSSALLWILDEPFSSLDKDGVHLVENCLKNHLAKGGAAIITSHQPFVLDKITPLVLNLESK